MIAHLAVVMDGNRRWAQKNKMNVLLGHSKGGLDAAKRTIEFCLNKGIAYLSLYTFSLENLKRTQEEKSFLFSLMNNEAKKCFEEFIERGIKIRFIGDRSLFPPSVLQTCNQLEERTKEGKKLTLNVLFCYGAQQEIISSVKALFCKIKNGLVSEDDITKETFEQCLWTNGAPPPDLIIRTGGRRRLSNFLLYQSAYSEFYFLDCLWPEVTQDHLEKALASFGQVERNFGV